MKDALGHGSGGSFGKRATIPSLPPAAHQSRIRQLVSTFAKSESGEGKVPDILQTAEQNEPDTIGNAAEAFIAGLSDHKIDASTLMHFAHFLGFLGACAVIDLVVLGLQKGFFS